MNKNNVFTRLAIFAGILITINFIAQKLFFRLDFTADKRYTLSEATKNTLKELEDVVTVKAYFSEDLPPQLMNTRKEFEEQLIEYENRSQGNLVYEFINPNENEEAERKAQTNGINPLIVNVTERDQVKQLRAYMGAKIQMADRDDIIPVIQPGTAMEFDLTTAIKKLATVDKLKIALLQGQGQPDINVIPQLSEQLNILYEVEPYTLTDSLDIPLYYRSLLLFNPTDTLNTGLLTRLDRFLDSGGSIFLAHSNFSGNINGGFISNATDIGLTGWLSKKGINLSNQIITDVNCASVGVPQQLGPFSVTSQVKFPYFPIVSSFQEHPVSTGLEAILLPLANRVGVNESDTTGRVIPIAFSSQQSGLVATPFMVDINKEWTESDFTSSNEPVAVAVEWENGKMVVVGSGNFVLNGNPGQQQQQVSPDNINFVANAIDWMSDDTGLNDLRTKGITARLLDPVDDTTKNLIKYGNVLIPIFLIIAYGIFRRQRNLRKRQRWLEGKYV